MQAVAANHAGKMHIKMLSHMFEGVELQGLQTLHPKQASCFCISIGIPYPKKYKGSLRLIQKPTGLGLGFMPASEPVAMQTSRAIAS